MFIHNFKYTLKTLLRKKSLIFWTLIFPIALATFFNMAFSDIEKEDKLKVFDIAVVNNQEFKENEFIKQSFKELSKKDKNQMFDIKYVDLEKAKKLLKDDKIEGYFVINNNKPKVVIDKNGINQTILKYVTEEIYSMQTITKNLVENETKKQMMKNSYVDSAEIYKKVISYTKNSDVKLNNVASSNLSFTVIEFYTLIAMTCLYGGIVSMVVVNECLPNMCSIGKRKAISKTKKSTVILSSLLASYVIEFIGAALLFLFTLFVLKIDYGPHLGLVILLTLVGSLAGLSIGIFISTVLKANENLKTGIILGYSMLCSFLSGMMGITMKYVIDKNIPIINWLNPANMITDGLYSLYYYETYSRYLFNLVSLLTFSFVLIIISFMVLRRQRYDSI